MRRAALLVMVGSCASSAPPPKAHTVLTPPDDDEAAVAYQKAHPPPWDPTKPEPPWTYAVPVTWDHLRAEGERNKSLVCRHHVPLRGQEGCMWPQPKYAAGEVIEVRRRPWDPEVFECGVDRGSDHGVKDDWYVVLLDAHGNPQPPWFRLHEVGASFLSFDVPVGSGQPVPHRHDHVLLAHKIPE